HQLSYVRARPGRAKSQCNPGSAPVGGTARQRARSSLPLISLKRLLAPVPLAAVAIVLALVALLAYGVAQNTPDRTIDDAVAAGKRIPAPKLDLPRLDNRGRLSLTALRGKVVAVNF